MSITTTQPIWKQYAQEGEASPLIAYRRNQKQQAASRARVEELKASKAMVEVRFNELTTSTDDAAVIAQELPAVEWEVKLHERRITAAASDEARVLDESAPLAYAALADLADALKGFGDQLEKKVAEGLAEATRQQGCACKLGPQFVADKAGTMVQEIAKLHPVVVQAREASAAAAAAGHDIASARAGIDAAEASLLSLRKA
ncbi:hypothetical protein [Verrucomicrobium sp. BvORR034]|uniref:hypothetical protein n=1 Tax=Verrucomicrobium sp. BvORR034 TaxID=1396418 RepID=UPI000678D6F2|nr:hypothetical protein [Verrucomicrobium sp. BvORR034]